MTPSRLFVFVLFAVLLWPQNATAQAPSRPFVAEETATLTLHLRNALRAPDAQRRELALVDVIALANCESSCVLKLRSIQKRNLRVDSETEMGAGGNVRDLAPDVRRLYRLEPIEARKLLALSALIHIGEEQALESLIEMPADRISMRVQQQTNRSIATFFLERYPELRHRAERTGHLSLVEVRRARAAHLKRARIAEAN